MTSIVLVRARTLSSFMIRARLREEWSHAAIMLDTARSLIDATFKHGGVRYRNGGDVLHKATDFVVLPLRLPRPIDASLWLAQQIGKPYDWRSCWGFAFGDREWRDDSAWFCFELVAGFIEAGSGYRFKDRERVTAECLKEAAQWLEWQANIATLEAVKAAKAAEVPA